MKLIKARHKDKNYLENNKTYPCVIIKILENLDGFAVVVDLYNRMWVTNMRNLIIVDCEINKLLHEICTKIYKNNQGEQNNGINNEASNEANN